MNGWRIAAAELRIPRRLPLAAHKMVIVIDPQGRVVRQLNGLASSLDRGRGVWRPKPIGYLRSDRLRAYDTDRYPQTFLPMSGVGGRNAAAERALERGDVVDLVGAGEALSSDDVECVLGPALKAIEQINRLSAGPDGGGGIPYPFLGLGRNSNSVFTTLVEAMGLEPPVPGQTAPLAPGWGRRVLSREEICRLRDGS